MTGEDDCGNSSVLNGWGCIRTLNQANRTIGMWLAGREFYYCRQLTHICSNSREELKREKRVIQFS